MEPALPFWANFVAGAIAGVTEILTFYPLDVVKTRMQLDTGTKSIGLVGSFRSIIAQEGYVPSHPDRRVTRLNLQIIQYRQFTVLDAFTEVRD
jgi:Mitochondrial carrier protein